LPCKICEREVFEEGFCEFHLKAYCNLSSKFELWRKALDISWKEYLSQIVENSSAGNWVKEVANYLIENGET
jgi:hypothetical protein